MKKLTLLVPKKTNKEIKITVIKDDPIVKPLRVIDEPQRVKANKLCNSKILLNKRFYRSISPKIVHNDTTKHSAETYCKGTFQQELPTYHYLTRTKIARATATVQ